MKSNNAISIGTTFAFKDNPLKVFYIKGWDLRTDELMCVFLEKKGEKYETTKAVYTLWEIEAMLFKQEIEKKQYFDMPGLAELKALIKLEKKNTDSIGFPYKQPISTLKIMNDFHNTINISGDALQKASTNAKGQQVLIKEYFEVFPDKEFTPVQILDNLHLKVPITSVRRAMSNLTQAGVLIKTQNKRMGMYGVENYTWKLAVNSKTNQLNMSI